MTRGTQARAESRHWAWCHPLHTDYFFHHFIPDNLPQDTPLVPPMAMASRLISPTLPLPSSVHEKLANDGPHDETSNHPAQCGSTFSTTGSPTKTPTRSSERYSSLCITRGDIQPAEQIPAGVCAPRFRHQGLKRGGGCILRTRTRLAGSISRFLRGTWRLSSWGRRT